MAQPRDPARSETRTPAANGASPAGQSSATSNALQSARATLSRLWTSRPASGQASGTPSGQPAKRAGFGRLLFAMLIFIVAAQVGEYLLFFLNDRFPGWHLASATVVADHNFPLLGGTTRFTFIYLIFIVLIYAGLYRFNVFPKDPFGAKARMQQQRDASQQATTAGAGSTRAARRHAARHATTSTSGSVKAPSARQVAAQAKAVSPVRQTGGSDTEYERVKEAQRLRRRRDMKR